MRGDAPVSRGGATGSTGESAEISEFVELRNANLVYPSRLSVAGGVGC